MEVILSLWRYLCIFLSIENKYTGWEMRPQTLNIILKTNLHWRRSFPCSLYLYFRNGYKLCCPGPLDVQFGRHLQLPRHHRNWGAEGKVCQIKNKLDMCSRTQKAEGEGTVRRAHNKHQLVRHDCLIYSMYTSIHRCLFFSWCLQISRIAIIFQVFCESMDACKHFYQ